MVVGLDDSGAVDDGGGACDDGGGGGGDGGSGGGGKSSARGIVVSATASDVVDTLAFVRGRMLADQAPTPTCSSSATTAHPAATLSARTGCRPTTTSAMPMGADDGSTGWGCATRGRAA